MAGRIPALEATRGVAALMVIAVHVNSFHEFDAVPQDPWLHFTASGGLGVQVFFALSGLVLYLPYARGDRALEPRAYLAARLLRIIPGLWVALAVSATVLGMWSWALIRHGLFVNPDAAPGIDPIPPAWTLTIEMGFYLLLPALVWLFSRHRRYRVPVLLSIVLVGPISRQLFTQGWPMTPLTYVDSFALGMLAAVVVARVGRLPRWTLTLAALAFTAGLFSAGNDRTWVWSIVLAGGFFAVALTPLAAVNPRTPPLLVWLGTISYGVYLWHWPILEIASDHGLYRLPDSAEIAIVAAFSILAGWLSWQFIELPVLRRRELVMGLVRPSPTTHVDIQARERPPTVAVLDRPA